MNYPKVHAAVPLGVENEKYLVDLDGHRRPNLGKRHSHRGNPKVVIRLSSCA
jgi:hypothetical protein